MERPGPKQRKPLFINGKFYSGALNGVHRVADRLIRELDSHAMSGGLASEWDIRLLLPQRDHWAPPFARIRPVPQIWGHSQMWEQIILPYASRGGTLACFANLAPWAHGHKVTMVHDAQFRLSPQSYPPKLRFGYRALIPLGARNSDVVLGVSAYACDTLTAFGIASADRMKILHNGADHILEGRPDRSVLADHGLRPSGYLLLFGSTAHYKNLRVIFNALTAGPHADLPLVVVGSSREALIKAGLSPPLHSLFLGTVDDDILRALYEGALCLLYPSRTEGFGLPPAEAMMCGCPVIASPAGAIPEICQDAILYAGMDEPGEWRQQITTLRWNDSQRAAKIAHGRARASRFTWQAAGNRLVEILTPLVERC